MRSSPLPSISASERARSSRMRRPARRRPRCFAFAGAYAEKAKRYILSAIALGVAGICFADNCDERDLRGYQLAALELLRPELDGIMQERRAAAWQALAAARRARRARARVEKAIRSAAFAQDRRVATARRALGESEAAALRARRAMGIPAGPARSGVVPTTDVAVEHALHAWRRACCAEQYAPDELARAYGHHLAEMQLLHTQALAALRASRDDTLAVQQSELANSASVASGSEERVAMAGVACCSSAAGASVRALLSRARAALWCVLVSAHTAGAEAQSLSVALGTSIRAQELLMETHEARAAQLPRWH
jgi:hypothetical protein